MNKQPRTENELFFDMFKAFPKSISLIQKTKMNTSYFSNECKYINI